MGLLRHTALGPVPIGQDQGMTSDDFLLHISFKRAETANRSHV